MVVEEAMGTAENVQLIKNLKIKILNNWMCKIIQRFK